MKKRNAFLLIEVALVLSVIAIMYLVVTQLSRLAHKEDSSISRKEIREGENITSDYKATDMPSDTGTSEMFP